MTCAEVFARLDAHIKSGMILHDSLANYYDFLGLMGLKRLHEYHFLRESAEMRGLNRYHINHFGLLIPPAEMKVMDVIPGAWKKTPRQDVSISTKRSAIKAGMDIWCGWERETKKLYEQSYTQLCGAGEIAAACKVREMVAAVDMELKEAERMALCLQTIDYDLPTVMLMQDDLHQKYMEREKGIGVDIC